MADPSYFETWEGVEEWVVDGPDGPIVFFDNPRRLIGEEEFALVRMHGQCDRGMSGHVWPDGGALLDQPNLLIEAFETIGSAKARRREAERGT